MKNKYVKRIRHILIAVLFVAIVLVVISYNFFIEYDAHENRSLVVNAEAAQIAGVESHVNDSLIRDYFIIYDETSELSVTTARNIEETLAPMKQEYRMVSIDEFNLDNVKSNDTIILTLTSWESYGYIIDQIFLKVSEGTNLFVSYLPMQDSIFINHSRKLGIYETGSDIPSQTMSFKGDTILGLTNDKVTTDAIATVVNAVRVVKEATVLIEGAKELPQFYIYLYGAGTIGVYTADNLNDKLQRGLIAGMLGALEDELVYPIIQTGVMFIDDFPSPMGGYNEKIQEEYGMDVQTFVRTVWWPDVLALGKQYGIVYTGAVITSYNDVMNAPFPEDDGLTANLTYYYGREIIRSGGEVCWHGYNHQPLKFDSYVDITLAEEYHVWSSVEQAEIAIKVGINKFKQAFPYYKLHGYVPPSNVITVEGQKVLEKIFEEALIVCGLYLSGEPDAPSFDYKEENGTIFFPRVECDCFLTDLVKYSTSSVITHVGAFSHFIHPDDILDDERSHKKKWHEMRLEYEKLLKFVSNHYGFIRMETVTEAGQHVAEWDNMQVETNYYNDHIDVWVANVNEPYYLMLRTNKKIIPSKDYTYQQIEDTAYLISSDKDYVKIQLEARD